MPCTTSIRHFPPAKMNAHLELRRLFQDRQSQLLDARFSKRIPGYRWFQGQRFGHLPAEMTRAMFELPLYMRTDELNGHGIIFPGHNLR